MLSLLAPLVLAALTDWPSYRGALTNAGVAPGPAHVRALTLHRRWTHRTDSWITSTPVVAGGLVYVGSWSGSVIALDRESGVVRWSAADLGVNPDQPFGETRGVIGSIAVDGDTAYAVSGSCYAGAFDVRTGAPRWKRPICSLTRNDDTFASPIVAGGLVLVGINITVDRPTDRGRLLALDAATGAVRWRFDPVRYDGTGCGVSATPAIDVHSGTVYVGIGNPTPRTDPPPGPDPLSDSIVALDLVSGRVRWSYGPVHPHDTQDRDFFASPNLFALGAGTHARLVVGEANKDGSYYALDARTGRELWRRSASEDAYAMVIGTTAVSGGGIVVPIYANDGTGGLVLLDARNGSVLARRRTAGIYGAPLLRGGAIFVTEIDGTLDVYRLGDLTPLTHVAIGRPARGRGPSASGDLVFATAGSEVSSYEVQVK